MRRYAGAFLCAGCGRDDMRAMLVPRARSFRPREVMSDPFPPLGDDGGMVRKNLTITFREDKFLQLHREINQSALFRRAVLSLMEAEVSEIRRARRAQARR